MLSTFVKDSFRYESHLVHGRDSLVDLLQESGLLSESDAVQPLIGKARESGVWGRGAGGGGGRAARGEPRAAVRARAYGGGGRPHAADCAQVRSTCAGARA